MNSDQDRYDVEVGREQWEAEQALPPHKRAGYYEQLCDHADYLRKAAREEALLKSIEEKK